MPTSQDAFRVLAITTNSSFSDLVGSAIKGNTEYLFISRQLKANELMEGIESLQPHCIVLDFAAAPTQPLELLEGVAWQFPEITMVAALPKSELGEANRAVLAGARAFITQPLQHEELLETLGRIRHVHERMQATKGAAVGGELPAANRGTFVVFSPKGGVGCSVVAINLAIALRAEVKRDVLLMDAKLLFGDLDIMLNLKTDNSIADLIPHIGALDESLIRDVVAEHVSGIKVLAAPPNPLAAQGIHPEELHRILTSVQGVYPHVIIDSGSYLNDNTVTLMDGSHKVLLVMNPDIACLRGASRFLDLCRTTLSFPKERILVVVNEQDQQEGLALADIERSLETKIFATLPWDRRSTLQSINRGVPLGMQSQNTPLRRAFQAMAKGVAAIAGASEASIPTSRKKMPEVLSRSSRLG